MSHFATTLTRVLKQSYGGKQTALALSSGVEQSEISRLLRNASSCTPAKLVQFCQAPDMGKPDQIALCLAAIHDWLPPDIWSYLFEGDKDPAERLRQTEGFYYVGAHKLPPFADQVMRYLLDNAQRDPDVVTALELMGKFMAIKAKEPTDAPDPT